MYDTSYQNSNQRAVPSTSRLLSQDSKGQAEAMLANGEVDQPYELATWKFCLVLSTSEQGDVRGYVAIFTAHLDVHRTKNANQQGVESQQIKEPKKKQIKDPKQEYICYESISHVHSNHRDSKLSTGIH